MNKVDNVQILRAIAALLVALGHFEGMAAAKMGYVRTHIPTGSGVDLFFIVSGFVMMLTFAKFQGRGIDGSVDFFLRRLIRIIPLYWLCTLLFLGVNLISAHSEFTLGHIAASFLFIPFDGEGTHNGLYFPVFDLGWTLNFEMFFYVLFALSLLIANVKPVIGATILLVLSVALGSLIPASSVQPYFWTRPIILEFAIGMFIAWLFIQGVRLPKLISALGILVAGCLLAFNLTAGMVSSQNGTTLNDFGRVLGWGLPMGILFASVVLTTVEAAKFRFLVPLTAIGDASYSLYLVHPFVIIFLWQVWRRVPMADHYPGAFVFVGVVGTIVAALLSYRIFEKPVSSLLNRGLRRRVEKHA